MPATFLAGVTVVSGAAVVRIDAAKCFSSQFPRTRGIRGPNSWQDLRTDVFSSQAKQVVSSQLLHGAKKVVSGHASKSHDGKRAMCTRAISVKRTDERTDKREGPDWVAEVCEELALAITCDLILAARDKRELGRKPCRDNRGNVSSQEIEGHKKWSSEPQAILPKVDSEAAAGGGGLGDFFSVDIDPQDSRNVQAELLFPVKGFKRCMEARQGFDFIICSPESLHQGAELITTQQKWMTSNGKPTFLQELSEDESLLSVSTENKLGLDIITQLSQHLQVLVFSKWTAPMVASILVLQICSQAWAGPEVAQINLNSSFDLGDFSDIQSGFASAFLLIFFSEIGDKTFFIAALLATRKSGFAVFSGTFGALSIMTVISVFLGRIFHYIDGILPSFGDTKLPVDDIAAVLLLVYFGVHTLLEAASMQGSESAEEKQEAELAIAGAGVGGAVTGTVATTFALVFVAEWGDKSFFSTIALSAASSPLGVVTGAIVGHGAATLLAVVGGSFLGNYISEKVIAYAGGVLFLFFAGLTVVDIIN